MQKVVSPEGEEFYVEEETTNRILNEGIPFIIVDIKERRLAIKEGEHFLFTNGQGDITADNTSGLGFYYRDTRFLSCFEFMLNGRSPILLSSTAERDYLAHVELTNADIREGSRLVVPQETLNIRRLRVIKDGLYERVRIQNYNPFPVRLELGFAFNADFADIFEVRGLRRQSRGKLLYPKVVDRQLILAYLGEDEVFRQTRVSLPQRPSSVEMTFNKTVLYFNVDLEATGKEGARVNLTFFIEPGIGGLGNSEVDFSTAVTTLRRSYELWEEGCTKVFTDNELFNGVLNRGTSDIRALLTDTAHGRMFYAGIPWYVAPFGRDSLITSIQVLSLTPEPASQTLGFLAALQGRETNHARDEEPGKILHEIRQGELANLREIPHTPYYGSVDSTALFLILFSEYYRWTNDRELIERLLETVEGCLDWLENYGDKDGDIFVEYERRSRRGLINQGWKDSWNAVAHSDGHLAEPPVAMAEVQGYVYRGLRGVAEVYRDLGRQQDAAKLEARAAELKKRFNEAFWMPDEGFFAMALDGKKNQVKTIASNPGQCLWAGIIDDKHTKAVVDRLMEPDMFSGWGIRTVSKQATIYNPMSYHNGSVWPHDNSIILSGVKNSGFDREATVLASALFDTAIHHAYFRLPEVFCGFTRRGANWPVSYPVACTPQAWAAGSVFLLLQTLLGIVPDAPNGRVRFRKTLLPGWLNRVELSNLHVGSARVSGVLERDGEKTVFKENGVEGSLEVVLED